jgi:hypothetical protein
MADSLMSQGLWCLELIYPELAVTILLLIIQFLCYPFRSISRYSSLVD